MAITFHPRPGQILLCDFSKGFEAPEMVKKRPVVVLTPNMDGRDNLATVVALSSARPDPIRDFHCQLPAASMPMIRDFNTGETWVKGDMIYSVGFHRLELIKLGGRGPNGKRKYYQNRLSRDRIERNIFMCFTWIESWFSCYAYGEWGIETKGPFRGLKHSPTRFGYHRLLDWLHWADLCVVSNGGCRSRAATQVIIGFRSFIINGFSIKQANTIEFHIKPFA